jgi:iron-sulfur cluster assembly accessory protein
MTTPTQTPIQTKTIQITPAAIEVVRGLREQQNLDESYALRVYIAGESCSGFQYGMALDNKPHSTDSLFEIDGLTLLVDETSIQYMDGATIDFIDDQRGKGFLVDNPNAIQTCSCEGGACDCGSSDN